MVYKSPKVTDAISYGYLDRNNNLWLCGKDSILLYNTKTTQVMRLPNLLEDNITVVEQADDTLAGLHGTARRVCLPCAILQPVHRPSPQP